MDLDNSPVGIDEPLNRRAAFLVPADGSPVRNENHRTEFLCTRLKKRICFPA